MDNIDVADTLTCVSAVISIICYVLLFLTGKEELRTEGWIEHKGMYLLLALAMTVPIVNVVILVIYTLENISSSAKKRKAIKDIPASLIKLTQTIIDAKDYEYVESDRMTGESSLKNNKLEITITAHHLKFRTKLYSTNAFASAITQVQKEKAENITEQLLDAYIKTRKGTE